MHFDKRWFERTQTIAQRKAGVEKTGGIDHKSIDAVIDGPIDAFDRFAFDMGIEISSV